MEKTEPHSRSSMILSPVQLLKSQFVKISVELSNEPVPESTESAPVELDIEHMTHIERHSTVQSADNLNPDLHYYVLALGIRSSQEKQHSHPYKFEILVTGIISVDPRKFKPDNNSDDSATKFGFSILYGQIREMLTTTTGRMLGGQFILPTMSFMDEKFPTDTGPNE